MSISVIIKETSIDFYTNINYTLMRKIMVIIMKFTTDIPKEKYEKFVKNHPMKSHFLQSYAWGQFAKKEKNQTPYYVGILDDKDNILGASLLLQKRLPLGFSYFYAPRGFVIDFTNDELTNNFTNYIIEFIKKKKGIFLKIDPDLIWHEEDYKGEAVPLKYDCQKIFDNLKKIGFKHQGFTKNFETMQPRYTFRIDLTQSMEDIESKFSKTVKQRIKKGSSLGTNVRIGTIDDIEEFSKLMDMTEDRKDFVSHDMQYYKSLYEIYNKDNKMNLFIGSIDTNKVIHEYNAEKKDLEDKMTVLNNKDNLSNANRKKQKEMSMRIDKLNEYIAEYTEAKNKYGDIITLNSHVIIEYGDKAWTLYAGNHNVLASSQSNYKVYYEHIKYCHEQGIKYYDHFGTIGDLNSNNPRYGLHLFKKSFGGNYIEFIGEFDYITNHFMYFCFTKLVPIYRKLVKTKAKKIKKKSVDNFK